MPMFMQTFADMSSLQFSFTHFDTFKSIYGIEYTVGIIVITVRLFHRYMTSFNLCAHLH